MSNQRRNLSIYVAEKEIRPKNESQGTKPWWHAFLILMDETQDSGVNGQVVQELHFNNDSHRFAEPEVIEKDRSFQWLKSLELLPCLGGREEDILLLWNHVLDMAQAVDCQGVEYGEEFQHSPEAVNCRKMVLCALDAMGQDKPTYIEFCIAVAGLKAETDFTYPVFSFERANQISLEGARAEFDRLSSYFDHE